MGYFLAVTAFKTSDENLVSEAIVDYCSKHDIKASILDTGEQPNEKTHGVMFSSKNGWSIVIWPSFFNMHDVPLAQAISKKLKIIVSTVNVYDSDYWSHYLFNNGKQSDTYCSIPNYWAENKVDSTKSITEFKGSPEIVAQHFGINVETIEGYYQHLLEDKIYGKAYQDDDSELDDFWVFADFWKKLGIEYPKDIMSFHSVVDLTNSFGSKLPQIG